MKQRRIFIKYCLRYLLAFMLVLLCCIPLAGVALRSIEDYIINENYLHLTESASVIQQEVQSMDHIAQVIRQNEAFRVLSMTNGVIAKDKILNLKNANTQMIHTGALYSFFDYSFALFRDNDMYISTVQCSERFDRYFDRLFFVEDPSVASAASFREQLFARVSRGDHFWKLEGLRYYNGEGQLCTATDAILYIASDRTSFANRSAYVMAFVLQAEDLQRQILTRDAFREGKLQIIHTVDGSILVDSTGEGDAFFSSQDGYHFITHHVPSLNWTIHVGVPAQIISAQSQGIRSILLSYVLIGIAAVLVLTLALSYRQYKNVQGLFGHMPEAVTSLATTKNEYEALRHNISAMSKDREAYLAQSNALAQQNRLIMLENLITRGVHTPEEHSHLAWCFASPPQAYCVALMRMNASGAEPIRLGTVLAVECLKESLTEAFVHVHTGVHDEIFLFSLPAEGTDASVHHIRTAFEGIAQALAEDVDVTLNVGLSAVQHSLYEVNDCYHQARRVVQAYCQEFRYTVNEYEAHRHYDTEGFVSVAFLDKLYNCLLCAERDTLRNQFDGLTAHYRANPVAFVMHKQRIFYAIYNVIYSARVQLTDTWGESKPPAYRDAATIEELAGGLYDAAADICQAVELRRKSRNTDLRAQLVSYVETHFHDATLTAASVCQVFGISEKYLYSFLKEQTGETFAGMLERVRTEAAIRYLTETDLSNEKIAKAVGFSAVNTFYRIFNKRLGVSPGAYRTNHAANA